MNAVLLVVALEAITKDSKTSEAAAVAASTGVTVLTLLVAETFPSNLSIAARPRTATPTTDSFVDCTTEAESASRSRVLPLALVLVTSPRQIDDR